MREFRRDPLEFLVETSRGQGNLFAFRVGPLRAHVVNDAELARTVLVDRAAEFHRSAVTKSVFGRVLGNGLLVSDGDFHRRQRRLSQPAFVPSRIDGLSQVAASIANDAVAAWADGEERSIDHEMEKITLGVVAKALFGAEVDADTERITGAMHVLQREMQSLFRSVFLPPAWLPVPQNLRLRRAVRAIDEVIRRAVRRRRETGAADGDLLSLLLAAVDDEGTGKMSDAQLRDEAVTLFLAGFETVANGLTWTWYALSQNPEVEQALHAELDGVLGERPPAASDLSRLKYTQSVVKEALRLYSPIWAFNRAPLHDLVLDGWRVRRGEMVLVSPPVLHMSPRYFDEPTRFSPARFAPDARGIPRGAYIPFGAGPHVCIGAQLALSEMTLVLAAVASRFRLVLSPGQKVEREALVSVCPKEPIRARWIARRPAIRGAA
jgi:cytochrome P450